MDIFATYYRTKFWITDFFKGSPIGKHYREIKRLSSKDAKQTEKYRKRILKEFLDYTTANSPFYSTFRGKDISDFPVVNKSVLLANYDKIKIPVDVIPNHVGALHIQSTSGSTGTPFAIPQDTEKRNRRVAELKFFGKIVGFKSHDMLVHLRTWNRWQQKTPSQIRRERIIPFDIASMDDENIQSLVDTINANKAKCLRGYASSFDLVANYVKKHKLKLPSVEIIIAGSEMLHDDIRMNVKNNLNCEIISQYADEECGVLAQESIPTSDSDNPMYLNNASYIFELLKLDEDVPAAYGELGRIVITDLYNHAFPIIRYDTGDTGIMLPPNEKSHGFPILGKLYGRRFDMCTTTTGSFFSPMTIGRILKHYGEIKQWQFIQNSEKGYTLRLILNEEVKMEEYLNYAVRELKNVLGQDASIKLEKVDGIPTLASGKRKPVVNEWLRHSVK